VRTAMPTYRWVTATLITFKRQRSAAWQPADVNKQIRLLQAATHSPLARCLVQVQQPQQQEQQQQHGGLPDDDSLVLYKDPSGLSMQRSVASVASGARHTDPSNQLAGTATAEGPFAVLQS
jgi:hypothetical protein